MESPFKLDNNLSREFHSLPWSEYLVEFWKVCPVVVDNIVRIAIVKTATGSYKRPASKFSVLPFEESVNALID